MALIEFQRASPAPSFVSGLAAHGSRPALITPGGRLSYEELDARVESVVRRLGRNRRLILLSVDNSVASVVHYLAALRGGHPVLLTASGPDYATRLIETYDPDVLMSDTTDPEVRRAASTHDLHPDLALLLATSGSTGSPKLVRLSHRNLQSNASAIAEYLRLTADERAISSLPLHYCYGLSVLNSHLQVGASVVLTDHSVVDAAFWELFVHTGATSFAGVPHTFDLLDRIGFDRMDLPTLRYVTQAGGKLPADKVNRYASLGARDGWELFVMYGQTEATARMAFLPPQFGTTHSEAIGVPIPGGSLTVDSPDERGVGELLYRGENVMLGYAEKSSDLALGGTISELRTGDLGRITEAGLFEVVGRTSRFVKVFGLRIDLDAVECRLAQSRLTAACAGDDKGLVVALEQPGDSDLAVEILTRELALPRSHVQVIPTKRLPRLVGGKPDYTKVRAGSREDRVAEAPKSSTADPAAAVRAVFVQVLGIEPGDADTFVGLGGDSLSYVEMSICLEAVLGSLPRDWHNTPVGQLAPSRPGRKFVARTDTSVVIRAVSIVLIVGTHAKLWQLPGGAHALLIVAGYNFARFQLRSKRAFASVARVALPSMLWISVVAAASDKYGWPNSLLVNGLVNRPGDHWGYWFLEALIQMLIPLTALFAVPAVARLEERRPFAVAAAALGFGLLFRFDVVELSKTFPISRPHEVFWLFALGWAAACVDSWRGRLVVSAVALAAIPGFFDTPSRAGLVMTAMLLVSWVPSVPLPRPAQRLVAPLAGASLYIYLTHFQVYPPLERWHGPLLAVTGSLLVGIAGWLTARRLIDRFEAAWRAGRVSPRPARPSPELMPR
ncbi:MAG TPA: AMP-binding protein [Acidimicrobiales bacterium]|nr:AMP-binding protein [Acidimicrobiales bacterium]